MGCVGVIKPTCFIIIISIHSSIHAPTWGATLGHNPSLNKVAISIHAPTWGATRLDKRGSSSDKFQSTHPHGVRPADSVGISALTRFQSTHPHGVRLSQRTPNARPRGIFQSTHPHGVRRAQLHNAVRCLPISIHAPTWGATAKRRLRSCLKL